MKKLKRLLNITRGNVIFMTRWYPIVTSFFVTIGLLFLIFDIELYKFTIPLFGCSAFMSIKELWPSLYYKFCLWHQLLLIGLTLVSLIAFIKAFGLLDDLFTIRRLLLINFASIAISYIAYLLIPKSK